MCILKLSQCTLLHSLTLYSVCYTECFYFALWSFLIENGSVVYIDHLKNTGSLSYAFFQILTYFIKIYLLISPTPLSENSVKIGNLSNSRWLSQCFLNSNFLLKAWIFHGQQIVPVDFLWSDKMTSFILK